MNCSVCGATYADGQPACPNCGTPAQPMMQQPQMQPMGGMAPMGQPMQPQMGYQQPMGQPMGAPMGGMAPMGGPAPVNNQYMQGTGMSGFLNSLKSDYMKIVGLVGGLLVLISPFFSWCTLKVDMWGVKESESFSMFSLGREYSDVRTYYIWTVLLIVIGLGLLLWDAADFFPALADTKAKLSNIPYVELIAIGVGILVVVIALMNGTVKDVIELYDDLGGEASHGVGPIVAFIGLALAAVPRVMKIVKK